MLRTVYAPSPGRIVTVAYRLIVVLSTTPPRSSQYGGTSVPPPQKLIRSGARARISMPPVLPSPHRPSHRERPQAQTIAARRACYARSLRAATGRLHEAPIWPRGARPLDNRDAMNNVLDFMKHLGYLA